MAASQRLQAPVFYAVQTTPTRAGSYRGPYTIINPEADAGTVWVADNAGLQPGQGTPVYPGTSLRWEKDGDLWIVGSNATTQIIISYDVADWQPNPAAIAAAVLSSGVLIIDNPQTLFEQVIVGGGDSGWIDISRFQSLQVYLGVIAGVPADVVIQFRSTSTANLFEIPIVFGGTPTTAAQSWQSVIPCIGREVRIIANSTVDVVLISSYRPSNQIQEISSTGDPWLNKTSITNLLAGTLSNDFALKPYMGEVEMQVRGRFSGAPPSMQVQINTFDHDGSNLFVYVPVPQSGTNQFFQIRTRFALMGQTMLWNLSNNSAFTITSADVKFTPVLSPIG